MKSSALAVLVLVTVAGCGGKADVTFRNNTSRYVDGEIEGEKFGLSVNGATTRTVEWSGMFKSSIDADVHCRYHMNHDGASPVAGSRQDRMKLENNAAYTYEVYFNSGGAPELRLVDMRAGRPILGP